MGHLTAMIDRIAPTQRPDGRPVGSQRWRNLLFLHWEVPADALAARLPRDLTVDTFEGLLLKSVLWIVGLLVIFIPLAVRLYRKLD